MRVVVAAVLIAALAAGCDDNDQKYSRSDVERAFQSQGFDLTAPLHLSDGPTELGAYSGGVYRPRTREEFVILVYDHEADADDAFQTLRSQASSATFDVRNANVVVTSDEGIPSPTRKRVRAAPGSSSETSTVSESKRSASVSPPRRAVARQPTFKEREAITNAMPGWLRRYPVGCVWLEISVSSNGRYAKAGYGVVNPMKRPCSRYVSNGGWFLKKQAKWKIIFNGSDPPPCSLKVPRELTQECLR